MNERINPAYQSSSDYYVDGLIAYTKWTKGEILRHLRFQYFPCIELAEQLSLPSLKKLFLRKEITVQNDYRKITFYKVVSDGVTASDLIAEYVEGTRTKTRGSLKLYDSPIIDAYAIHEDTFVVAKIINKGENQVEIRILHPQLSFRPLRINGKSESFIMHSDNYAEFLSAVFSKTVKIKVLSCTMNQGLTTEYWP